MMTKTTNPLVGSTPYETLGNCRDVLKFIEFSMYRENLGEEVSIPEQEREGLFHVLDTISAALGYEQDRDAALRKPSAA